MTLSEELQWRGFVNQTTLTDLSFLDGDSFAFYFGVDPSADSMTIGNLAAAMMVRHFIDYGHEAYLLVGGATGYIGGDPDGKKTARELKTVDEVAHNTEKIAAQYSQVFASKPFTVVNNYDWFKEINYLDFLRSVGNHVALSQMLGRDFVQSRLGEGGTGMNYAEFSYALIQGYDFLHLFREHNVVLQVCGADQWGNSIAGVDMIRRIEGEEAHVYSTPLVVNKTTGVKFGKSEDGAIWLDAQKTSVYQFYQFWLNVDDEGVIDYMKMYTLLSREEIEEIDRRHRLHPEQREAQKVIALEVTKLVHGEERANAARSATEVLFSDKVGAVDQAVAAILQEELPVVASQQIVDVLIAAGVASSRGEARRLIAGGAIKSQGEKITDEAMIVQNNTVIKKGKNVFIFVR